MDFKKWKDQVDAALEKLCGLSSDDLPDYCYRDEFEDDAEPEEAARNALREAGF